MKNELQGSEDDPKTEVHLDLQKEGSKLEGTRVRWDTWILVPKIYIHQRKISSDYKSQVQTNNNLMKILTAQIRRNLL